MQTKPTPTLPSGDTILCVAIDFVVLTTCPCSKSGARASEKTSQCLLALRMSCTFIRHLPSVCVVFVVDVVLLLAFPPASCTETPVLPRSYALLPQIHQCLYTPIGLPHAVQLFLLLSVTPMPACCCWRVIPEDSRQGSTHVLPRMTCLVLQLFRAIGLSMQ